MDHTNVNDDLLNDSATEFIFNFIENSNFYFFLIA